MVKLSGKRSRGEDEDPSGAPAEAPAQAPPGAAKGSPKGAPKAPTAAAADVPKSPKPALQASPAKAKAAKEAPKAPPAEAAPKTGATDTAKSPGKKKAPKTPAVEPELTAEATVGDDGHPPPEAEDGDGGRSAKKRRVDKRGTAASAAGEEEVVEEEGDGDGDGGGDEQGAGGDGSDSDAGFRRINKKKKKEEAKKARKAAKGAKKAAKKAEEAEEAEAGVPAAPREAVLSARDKLTQEDRERVEIDPLGNPVEELIRSGPQWARQVIAMRKAIDARTQRRSESAHLRDSRAREPWVAREDWCLLAGMLRFHFFKYTTRGSGDASKSLFADIRDTYWSHGLHLRARDNVDLKDRWRNIRRQAYGTTVVDGKTTEAVLTMEQVAELVQYARDAVRREKDESVRLGVDFNSMPPNVISWQIVPAGSAPREVPFRRAPPARMPALPRPAAAAAPRVTAEPAAAAAAAGDDLDEEDNAPTRYAAYGARGAGSVSFAASPIGALASPPTGAGGRAAHAASAAGGVSLPFSADEPGSEEVVDVVPRRGAYVTAAAQAADTQAVGGDALDADDAPAPVRRKPGRPPRADAPAAAAPAAAVAAGGAAVVPPPDGRHIREMTAPQIRDWLDSMPEHLRGPSFKAALAAPRGGA